MNQKKGNLPETIKVNDTYMLRDLALAVLFPSYWAAYIRKCSKENAFKVIVVATYSNEIDIQLMEVSPVVGEVIVPTGIRNKIAKKDLYIAIVYSSRD